MDSVNGEIPPESLTKSAYQWYLDSKMGTAIPSIIHPHITKNPDVCGGSPVIVGTRFPVRSVVFYILKTGLTPEEMVEKFSHLSLAQVYDALAYYYDNRPEIEQDIQENTEETVRDTKD